MINGFNSWKRTLNSIEVIFEDKKYYFMSCEEASRYFNIRNKIIGECLRQVKYCNKQYIVKRTSIENVLNFVNLKTIEEYYHDKIK